MSNREKTLLYVLVVAVFLIGNAMAFKVFYQPKMLRANSALSVAEGKRLERQGAMDSVDLFDKEIEWLKRYEPKAAATVQQTQTKLQQLVEREAQRNSLEIKSQKLQPSIEYDGLTYHRARMEIEVNGMEAGLYRWLDRLHSPNEFRAVTFMRLNPQKGDDTRVDCQIVVEQWFVPEETS
ncbi:MAG: hypothetical protein OSA48_06670 [Akkermansiaceae bacterium]|nr:hypothetical protein [Akkermansiaceae bacterium]